MINIPNNDIPKIEVITSNQYDREYEKFWLSFKTSVFNYIKDMMLHSRIEFIDNILDDYINNYSKKLNDFQIKGEFDKIKTHITCFLEEMCRVYILNYHDYHFGIFMTNLKRWLKIDKDSIKKGLITFILKFGKNINSDVYIYNNIQEVNFDIHHFVDIIVKDKKHQLLSKLHETFLRYYINSLLTKKYNIVIENGTCFRKILKKIKC